MPSPVFLWKRAYGGAHRSLPYAPHDGLPQGGQGRPPIQMDLGTVQPGRCGHRPLRRSYKRFGTERYSPPLLKGSGQFSDGAMGRVVREADPYTPFSDRTS